MEANIKELEEIYKQARELERKNQLLKEKYHNDEKYARLHKRFQEKHMLSQNERIIHETLENLKKDIDEQILKNAKMLENEKFVEKMIARLLIVQCKKSEHKPDAKTTKEMSTMIVKEYMDEFYGRVA